MPDQSTTHLTVEGMTCSHCEMTIRKYLESKSLKDVSVSFENEEVSFKAAEAEVEGIIAGIERLGYKVNPATGPARMPAIEKRFLVTVPFTAALLSAMVIPWAPLHDPYIQFALCVPVFLIGLWHFGRSAWGSLRTGLPNMDVLITIGVIASFTYSLWGTLAELGHEYQFYETTASIITLVLLGNVIEHRSVKQTTSAIRELGKLQPQTAKVVLRLGEQEHITELPVEQLRTGDLVQANTGDQIPADGTITGGSAWINEAMITGESVPVSKSAGDSVVGGTIVEDGSIKVAVSGAGENSTLARIIDMVKNARMQKAPMQKLADRISAIFVPVVVVIALATFLIAWQVAGLSVTRSLLNSVAVLVIACPCAMGLATPTAVAVGLGRSARRGILIRGADTTEKLREIRTIVFDKTGTLTTGDFRVNAIEAVGVNHPRLRRPLLDRRGVDELKAILLGLEQHSSHPIGKAICRELSSHKPATLTGIRETKGIGIEGTDEEGHVWRVGSVRILTTPAFGDPSLAGGELTTHAFGDPSLAGGELTTPTFGDPVLAEGEFDVFVTRDDVVVGGVRISDEVKPDARETVALLRERGYRTIMLSGDRAAKCKSVAEAIGIEEYHAEMLPAEKLQFIEKLSRQAPTAMVGDGINDAPALARATVGISLSDATQVAIQSSEVILVGGKLLRLAEALVIAKYTVRTIRQNLFWAFFYNVIAIPIAAVGLLSPMIAALSMAFSDVMVIGNSLRLRIGPLSPKGGN